MLDVNGSDDLPLFGLYDYSRLMLKKGMTKMSEERGMSFHRVRHRFLGHFETE